MVNSIKEQCDNQLKWQEARNKKFSNHNTLSDEIWLEFLNLFDEIKRAVDIPVRINESSPAGKLVNTGLPLQRNIPVVGASITLEYKTLKPVSFSGKLIHTSSLDNSEWYLHHPNGTRTRVTIDLDRNLQFVWKIESIGQFTHSEFATYLGERFLIMNNIVN